MLSVLDSDKRLADHFGGKVRNYKNLPADTSCTWDTTSCETCSRNSPKSA